MSTEILISAARWKHLRPKTYQVPVLGRTSRRSSASTKKLQDTKQRVVVKVAYVSQDYATRTGRDFRGLMRDHFDYITREGSGYDKQRPEAFDQDRTFSKEHKPDLEDIRDEKRFYKIILSPEHGDQLDLKEYTRSFMADTEKQLGQKLKWTAVEHHNTDNPHVHILIRGVSTNRKEVNFSRDPDLVKTKLRDLARDEATTILGHLTPQAINLQRQRDITAERVVSHDYAIAKAAKADGHVKAQNPHQAERLGFLVSQGLATRTNSGFTMKENWLETLKERASRADIIKNINYSGKGLQFVDKTTVLSGTVVKMGIADELTDRSYAIIRTRSGQDYYYSGPKARTLSVGNTVTFGQSRAVPDKDNTKQQGPEHDRGRER